MKWRCPYGKSVPTQDGKFKGRPGVATETHLGRPITLTQTGSAGYHVLLSIVVLQNHTYGLGVMAKT